MTTTIVVADDRASSRELIRAALDGAGYRIEEAADGLEALRLIRSVGPGLVILDLHMPGMDGFAVLAGMLEDPRLRGIPVAALTASAMHGDRERALAAGFTAYISKPVKLAYLRTEVARLIEESASDRRLPG